jgi:hypothetical protein
MLSNPILETFTWRTSTYERRTEWNTHGYAYVTMHDTDSGHGWGGFMSHDEWINHKRDDAPKAAIGVIGER